MEKIELRNVLPAVFAGRNDIQSDIWHKDIALERGKIYLIEAKSGSGKTSLCSYLFGYRNDYEGNILFDGTDIRKFRTKNWVELRKHSLSCVFQELRLFPELTAYENVAIKNNLTCRKSRKQIEEWFDALGIGEKLNQRTGLMSFGQQQRVAMIRALVQPFNFLLADEPVSHLDDANATAMGEIMQTEAAHQDATIVMTSIGKHIEMAYDKTFRL